MLRTLPESTIMNAQRTDWTGCEAPDFKSAGFRIVWVSGHTGTGKVRLPITRMSQVYIPSEDAKAWDCVNAATHTVGTPDGFYPYVKLDITGRGITLGPDGVRGTKARVTFNIDNADDTVTYDAWVIQNR